MILNNNLNYHKEITKNVEELNTEAQKVLKWVDDCDSILEIGCHTGYLSNWLSPKTRKLTGVDLNKDALAIAANYSDRTIHADIESEEFWREIQGEKFSYIIIMHVLEHLNNPWEILKRFNSHLTDDGQIIIALPNINNAKDRYLINSGRFDYTLSGVMDKTHLRFFNQKTARELIKNAGLRVEEYYSPWQTNPLFHKLDHYPVLHKFKGIFKKDKVPFFYKNKPNLTDVVMLFRCEKK